MQMNMRAIILIVAALLVAGVTAMLARSWIRSERTVPVAMAETVPSPQVEILVAATNLPAGRIIQDGDLTWQQWPDVSLPEPYIRKTSGQELNDLLGSVVRSGIRQAEPVTNLAVVKSGERGFLAAVLSPGMRAVSIQISATSGVSGFVFPGDRVDLLLTQDVDNGGTMSRAAETLLTDVRVIGVDQNADDQNKMAASVARTVTLEVTPRQAEQVALASRMGELSLSLRSLPDPTAAPGPETVLQNTPPRSGTSHVWDSDVSRILSRSGPAGHGVQVLRGGSSQRAGGGK